MLSSYYVSAVKEMVYMPKDLAMEKLMSLVDDYEYEYSVSFSVAYDKICDAYTDAALGRL